MGRLTLIVFFIVLFALTFGRAPPADRPDDLPQPKLYTVMRKMGLKSFQTEFDELNSDESPEVLYPSIKRASPLAKFSSCSGCANCRTCDTVYMSCYGHYCTDCGADANCATKCHREQCMPRHAVCMDRMCPTKHSRSGERLEPTDEAVLITPTPELESNDEGVDIFDGIANQLV